MADSDVTQAEFHKALDDLMMEYAPPHLSETDITVTTLAKRYKIGKSKARRLIDEMAADGKLEQVRRRDGASRTVDAWILKGTNGQGN